MLSSGSIAPSEQIGNRHLVRMATAVVVDVKPALVDGCVRIVQRDQCILRADVAFREILQGD